MKNAQKPYCCKNKKHYIDILYILYSIVEGTIIILRLFENLRNLCTQFYDTFALSQDNRICH